MKSDVAFSYNHSTFMVVSKKVLLFCFVVLLLTGCGLKKNNSDESVDSSETNVNEQIHVPKKNKDTSEPFDWNGITVPIPDDFVYDKDYSLFAVWINDSSASSNIYLVVHELFGYSHLDSAIPNYTLSDLPGIMNQTLEKVVSHYAYTGIDNVTRTPLNSYETECLGAACIHETGTIVADKYGEVHKYSYVAYYSSLKFPYYGEDFEALPSCWFAFVESEDPADIKIMESVLDYAVKNSKIN